MNYDLFCNFAVRIFIFNISNIKIMVNYKDLGLVNTREMFKRAILYLCIAF